MGLLAKGILFSFIILRRQMNNLDHEEHSNLQLVYLQKWQLQVKTENGKKYKVRI